MTVETAKTRVAVVFGGRSAEHAISCVSAGSVMAALDPDRYEVVPVGITREGGWVLHDGGPLAIVDGRLPEVTGGAPVTLVGDPAGRGLARLGEDAPLIGVDVAETYVHVEVYDLTLAVLARAEVELRPEEDGGSDGQHVVRHGPAGQHVGLLDLAGDLAGVGRGPLQGVPGVEQVDALLTQGSALLLVGVEAHGGGIGQ